MPVDEEEIPLMDGADLEEPEVNQVDWDNAGGVQEPESDDYEYMSDDGGIIGDQSDAEEARRKHEPDEEGKFHDDPLWWGKTIAEIRHATDHAKTEGNKCHKEGDAKAANGHWKSALKGAQKLKDLETEFRLHLNLAMGYTKLGKTRKALYHCGEALCDTLRTAVPPAMQAKAHFRRAEALESSGEVEKAIVSIKAALQIEPANADMRQKFTELKRLEQEHRKREKALFAGKQLLLAMSDDKADPPQATTDKAGRDFGEEISEAVAEETAAAEAEDAKESEDSEDDDDDGNEAKQDSQVNFDSRSLTDRAQANKLMERINGGGYTGCIDFVGEPMSFYGPGEVQENCEPFK